MRLRLTSLLAAMLLGLIAAPRPAIGQTFHGGVRGADSRHVGFAGRRIYSVPRKSEEASRGERFTPMTLPALSLYWFLYRVRWSATVGDSRQLLGFVRQWSGRSASFGGGRGIRMVSALAYKERRDHGGHQEPRQTA